MGRLFQSQLVFFVIFLNSIIFLTNGEICNESHVSHFYSKCKDNKRVAIYHYHTQCEEDGSFSLPNSVSNLPCDIECPAGKFLPFGTSSCISCDKGTYSIGNGDVYNSWNPIPNLFSTYCSIDDPKKKNATCSPWISSDSGDYLYSGENPENYVKTHLKFQAKFELNSGNKVRFTFKVDAENCKNIFCDGIIFYIDDIVQESVKKSHVLQWTTVEFPVTPGYHSLQWTFVKDFSVSQGQDRAFIRSIEFHGVNSAPESCSRCIAGTFSREFGSTHCLECDYNEYSHEKSSSCSPCPEWYTSLRGSAECTALPPCKESDYFPLLESCVASRMTRKKIWGYWSSRRDFLICQPDDNIPPETLVPCTCPIGQQLDSNGVCQYCPDGSMKSKESTICTPCGESLYSPRVQMFDEWSALPANFISSCSGDCLQEGWLPRGEKIVPSLQGGQFTSLLTYSFELENDGMLTIQYTNPCRSSSNCTLLAIVDPENDDPTSDRLTYFFSSYEKGLTKGKYTLTLQYVHNSDDAVVVSIQSIKITNTKIGGGEVCLSCSPGYEPLLSTCRKCPAGKFSKGNGPCLSPPENAVVEEEGMSDYLTCGPNTTPNAEKTRCDQDCTFSPNTIGTHPIKYNLTMLDDPQMHLAGAESSFDYFLNVCSRQISNGVCRGKGDVSLNTFGCQRVYSGESEAYDIGKVIGFLPLEPEDLGFPSNISVVEKGLKITLTEGQFGCNRTGEGRKRSTTIFLLCDIYAGVGTPVPKGKTAEVGERSCRYEFVWQSLYACPLCNIEDYDMVQTDCVNGSRFDNYIRNKNCWDPTPPSSRQITCKACASSNCSGHGVCNFDKGVCNCKENFSGDDCGECKIGLYGNLCQFTCPGETGNPCNGHGLCYSGKLGNGTCLCSTGWKGEKCNECDDGFQGDTCERIPAKITEIFPWWSFIIPVVVLVASVAIGLILWRQKKQYENRYRALEHSNPVPDDNPTDDQ